MMNNDFVIFLMTLTLLTACCTDNIAMKDCLKDCLKNSSEKGVAVTPIPPSSQPPVSESATILLRADSPSLGVELTNAMKSQKIIEVKLSTAVEPEKEKKGLQPTVLAEVIVAVGESHGEVSYEPIKAEMGLPLLVPLIPIVMTIINEWLKSGATPSATATKFPQANQFNVRMCYREQDNKVTKVMLVPRAQDPTENDKKKVVCSY